ncbi:hypothetical protein KVH09_36690 [Streptomyces olivaceus]|uniref:hypothetical protein n=1 Tax=Streptomyces olivaceus TaxID=47716 RepID=UPI001CCB5E70|nr:hypothetical protein [Streptomyces olivaceus]MBZ6296101.1 hypothetical protein [Streptomyces olivaceus]
MIALAYLLTVAAAAVVLAVALRRRPTPTPPEAPAPTSPPAFAMVDCDSEIRVILAATHQLATRLSPAA